VFPSVRFEYFLTLLKNCDFIIGNSSAGIREAPFYGKPTINIGTRQKNRSLSPSIINVDESAEAILDSIKMLDEMEFEPIQEFGHGNSDLHFIEVLTNQETWNVAKQKQFIDIMKEGDVK
jgi:UDP-N-acetylglucosamine 2-epimerase (hydrolysing)